MVFTVTFNPSLDYVVQIKDFVLGSLHRTEGEDIYIGGKGINVSMILKELGMENTALGFVGGFTGNEILDRLSQMGIVHDYVSLAHGNSRINIKLKSEGGVETELNGQGPILKENDLAKLYHKLEAVEDKDVLILSGSVPPALPKSTEVYGQIMKALKDRKIRFIVDAEGELLYNTLRYHPFLIKPNLHELGKLFDLEIKEEEQILQCGRRLQKEGARNILISMAGDGAILLTEQGDVLRQRAPRGKVINSVGAGDAMVAGFLAGLYRAGACHWRDEYDLREYEAAFRLSIAAGSASAFTKAYPTGGEIEKILANL